MVNTVADSASGDIFGFGSAVFHFWGCGFLYLFFRVLADFDPEYQTANSNDRIATAATRAYGIVENLLGCFVFLTFFASTLLV